MCGRGRAQCPGTPARPTTGWCPQGPCRPLLLQPHLDPTTAAAAAHSVASHANFLKPHPFSFKLTGRTRTCNYTHTHKHTHTRTHMHTRARMPWLLLSPHNTAGDPHSPHQANGLTCGTCASRCCCGCCWRATARTPTAPGPPPFRAQSAWARAWRGGLRAWGSKWGWGVTGWALPHARTYKQVVARTQARTHARIHTHTHTHTQMLTHTHMYTHTQTHNKHAHAYTCTRTQTHKAHTLAHTGMGAFLPTHTWGRAVGGVCRVPARPQD